MSLNKWQNKYEYVLFLMNGNISYQKLNLESSPNFIFFKLWAFASMSESGKNFYNETYLQRTFIWHIAINYYQAIPSFFFNEIKYNLTALEIKSRISSQIYFAQTLCSGLKININRVFVEVYSIMKFYIINIANYN